MSVYEAIDEMKEKGAEYISRLLTSANSIKNFCSNVKECDECPFNRSYGCIFREVPEGWNLTDSNNTNAMDEQVDTLSERIAKMFEFIEKIQIMFGHEQTRVFCAITAYGFDVIHKNEEMKNLLLNMAGFIGEFGNGDDKYIVLEKEKMQKMRELCYE